MLVRGNKTWLQFKAFVDTTGADTVIMEDTDDYYELAAKFDFVTYVCTLSKTDTESKDDFEANYKDNCNTPSKREVITQLEKNDKTLRTIWAMATTDEAGLATIAIKVPDTGRHVAYGDAEFENREFGDIVLKLELSDLDRLIAWQIALAMDPEAVAPVADEVVQANGYPMYPVLGHYDERNLDANAPNKQGTMGGGMAMTFKYGVTEAQTVGGYGHLPGGFYFVIVGKKATATAGQKFQVSVDWAEPT